MTPTHNILFVCSYNICRSAAAEAVLHYIIDETASPMAVSSAGLRVAQPGQCADAQMCKTAQQRGYDLSRHSSRSLHALSCQEFTNVIWFEEAHREQLLGWHNQCSAKLASINDYASYSVTTEVNDTAWSYQIMLDQIESACLGLWHHLMENNNEI